MTIKQIKTNFHHLIDEIDNEKILKNFYEVMNGFSPKNKTVDFWDTLTQEQKRELELAWEESEKEENLISHNEVMKETNKCKQNYLA